MFKVVTYVAADPGWKVRRNRYYVGTCCEQTIGIGLQLGRRAFGLQWRRPYAPTLEHDRTYHLQ
jgi:hypothetical protein